jgi:hypothetical protein
VWTFNENGVFLPISRPSALLFLRDTRRKKRLDPHKIHQKPARSCRMSTRPSALNPFLPGMESKKPFRFWMMGCARSFTVFLLAFSAGKAAATLKSRERIHLKAHHARLNPPNLNSF